MSPFLIANARLEGVSGTVDIVVADGRIEEIAPRIAPLENGFDARGYLVTPGFAESHIHLDKACILDRCGHHDGTLSGVIAAVSRAKASFTQDDIYARGRRVIEKAIVEGTNAMRTHVEIDPRIGLAGFEAVRRLKADFAWAMDIEICVFPQEGLLNNPGTSALLRRALVGGADLLGGCPYVDTDPCGHIADVFAMAGEFDVDLDFHLDFDLDPGWRHLDEVARQTIAHGWQGRVTVGHVTKLSALPREELHASAALLRDAGIAVTVLPATDLFLTGRDHDHLVPRGVAPAHVLMRAGVVCTIATNNILNPFTPFGDCSLPRMANLFANLSHLGTSDALEDCFAMIADAPAKLLGRARKIEVGAPATFIVLPARSRAQSVAEISRPIWGMKNGRVSFEHPEPRLATPD